MNTTATNTVITADAEFQKVDTKNGFDYYAIYDIRSAAWDQTQWVRVREGANASQVEDAFYQGALVTSL